MRYLALLSLLAVLFIGFLPNAAAQEILVPAGTLLRCTIDEPNFSSATASVGDPVLCRLNGMQEFGQAAFPRGSYLQGHLEADREPGHFVGKGYLKLEFDRIGLPNTDVPVPSKVVALRGYRLDREGDIVGKGHAKRDAAEWVFPPLWPWKVLALPARGPRPALKGESQLTLRLMDDIVIPKSSTLEPGWRYFGETGPKSSSKLTPSSSNGIQPPTAELATRTLPQVDNLPRKTVGPNRVTLIALKSDQTYGVTRYRIEGARLNFVLEDGKEGAVNAQDVDWLKTSQLNSERTYQVAAPTMARVQ